MSWECTNTFSLILTQELTSFSFDPNIQIRVSMHLTQLVVVIEVVVIAVILLLLKLLLLLLKFLLLHVFMIG